MSALQLVGEKTPLLPPARNPELVKSALALLTPLNEIGNRYLQSRGLLDVNAKSKGPWIAAPLFSPEGAVVSIQYRAAEDNIEPRFDNLPGIDTSRGAYFGSRNAKASPLSVIITEGMTDSLLALRDSGMTVIGLAGANAGKTLVQDFGKDYWKGRMVFLALDSDAVGEKNALRIGGDLRKAGAAVHRIELPEKDLCASVQAGADLPDLIEKSNPNYPPAPHRRLPGVADALASMPPSSERLPTGIPSLDRSLRGGLATGRIYTFIGPPHRGKTALAAQLGLKLAIENKAVFIGLFIDEGSWQAALMLSEGLGLSRDRLEAADPATIHSVRERTAALDIRLPDPSDSATRLETIPRWLEFEDPQRPVVVVVDSIQRVRGGEVGQYAGQYEKINARMELLRKLVQQRPATIVLLTSQANRSSYAAKTDGENANPIAAGAGSAAIEFDSDALYFMNGSTATHVTLNVLKNRPGSGEMPLVYLKFDFQTAQFHEISEEEAGTTGASPLDQAKNKVLQFIKENPNKTIKVIAAETQLPVNRVVAAVECLEDDGAIEMDNGKRGPTYKLNLGLED